VADAAPVGEDQILLVDLPTLGAGPLQPRSEPLRARIATLGELAIERPRILLDVERRSDDEPSVFSEVRAYGRGEVGWVTAVVRNQLFAIRLRDGHAAEIVRGL